MRPICAVFALALALACGCTRTENGKARVQKTVSISRTHSSGVYPIKVVCTTGMVADLVRTVGGPHVGVAQLMGQDVDPHLYRANTEDMDRLNQADLIFYNGLHLEGKMGETLERLGRKIPSFPVGEYLDPKMILAEEGEETPDPHIWFDVALWREAAGVVADALAKYDPAHADDYRARAEAYRKRLSDLHEQTRAKIASIPRAQRILVTSHDAFRYFGRAYDIEVRGVQGISTEAEASLKDVEDLVALIVDRKVKAVFIETSVSDRNVKSIIEGCGARGHKLKLGGTLFSDAMGAEGTRGGTYIGMIESNVDTIVEALK